jgi:hypothetical protein
MRALHFVPIRKEASGNACYFGVLMVAPDGIGA